MAPLFPVNDPLYEEDLKNEFRYFASTDSGWTTYPRLRRYISDIVRIMEDKLYWNEETGEVEWGSITMQTRGFKDYIDEEISVQGLGAGLRLMEQMGYISQGDTRKGIQTGGRRWNFEDSNIHELRALEEFVSEHSIDDILEPGVEGSLNEPL